MSFENDDGWRRQAAERPPGGGLLGFTIRAAGLVIGASVVAGIAVSYLGEVADVGDRPVRDSRLAAKSSQAAGGLADGHATGELEVRAVRGHFFLEAEVDGQKLLFLVDTGASKIIIAPKDAENLGFRPADLDFTQKFHTGNGVVMGAPVSLREIRIGQFSVYDVDATVNGAPLPYSLLGMSFLDQLDSYEVSGDRLVMRW